MKVWPEPRRMRPYYWSGEPPIEAAAPLRESVQADLCIVGGGVTGLSAALHAAQAGLKVVLLEARTLAWSASSRNAGYMIPYVDYDPSGIERSLGAARAEHYWSLAHQAVAYLPALVQRHGIDCDLQMGILMPARQAKTWARLQRGAEQFTSRYGMQHLERLEGDALRRLMPARDYAGALLHRDVPTLQPVKLMRGLATAARAAGALLHEGTEVTGYDELPGAVRVRTAQGPTVQADRLLLAGNAYMGSLVPGLARRFVAMYTNMIGTAPLPAALERQVLTERLGVLEAEAATSLVYRLTPDGRLLFGGGGPFVGRDGAVVAPLLQRMMAKAFPALRDVPVEHVWGGWFGMTMFSDTPDIGRLSPRVHYAQAIPVVWAVQHGRLLAEALCAGTTPAADYELLVGIELPPAPGGHWLSHTLRLGCDAIAAVRGAFLTSNASAS
jgi:gamma-glutamylputrescine oxidase